MQPKAFFFDRDGIVNTRILCGYVTCIEEFEFLPDFFDVFRRIREAGYLAVLITNQQGVGKGIMTEEALHIVHEHMQRELVEATGSAFDDIYYCTDLASVENTCRKPSPKMMLDAVERHAIDPGRSWMIGDTVSDAQSARAAGIGAILIGDFSGETDVPADYIFPSLRDFLDGAESIFTLHDHRH